MELQAEAERRKRAQILESEGTSQAKINVAEAAKREQILFAEGKQAEEVLVAEGKIHSLLLLWDRLEQWSGKKNQVGIKTHKSLASLSLYQGYEKRMVCTICICMPFLCKSVPAYSD